jgi:serine/threonine protein kinase
MAHRADFSNAPTVPSDPPATDDEPDTGSSGGVPRAGERFPGPDGRYVIVRELARGGMGVVLEAEDDRVLKRTVIIKMIRPDKRSAVHDTMFQQEAQRLATASRHPGVAAIYDGSFGAQRAGDVPHFVAEYITGAVDLLTYAETRYAKLSRSRARAAKLRLFLQVCDAMAFVHEHGIVHRDLKPDNIIVDKDGRVRIIDFGISLAPDRADELAAVPSIFAAAMGTPQYMSPEQWSQRIGPHDIDARTDVYALGVVVYELLLGRKPADLSDRPLSDEVKHAIGEPATSRALTLSQPAKPPTEVEPGFPVGLEQIILGCLRKRPGERPYKNADELGVAIRKHVGRPQALWALPLIAFAVWAAYTVGVPLVYQWTPLNTWFHRAWAWVAPSDAPLDHVVVVAADERTPVQDLDRPAGTDTANLGFDAGQRARPIWAQAIRRLVDAGAGSIVVDIFWQEPSKNPADDAQLVEALKYARLHGVPVVAGVEDWPASPDHPLIASTLLPHVTHWGGCRLHADERSPWRTEHVIRVNADTPMVSLSMAAATAHLRPGCVPNYELNERDSFVTARFAGRVNGSDCGSPLITPVDRLLAGNAPLDETTELPYKQSDVVGVLLVPSLPSDAALQRSTVRVEQLLTSPVDRFRLGGKAVLLANHHPATKDFANHPSGRRVPCSYGHALALNRLLTIASPAVAGNAPLPWTRVTARVEQLAVMVAAIAGVGAALLFMGRPLRLTGALIFLTVLAFVLGAAAFRLYALLLNPLVPIVALLLAGSMAGATPWVVRVGARLRERNRIVA